MSKRINVNPGQYYVAGRERMGENLGQEKEKGRLRQQESELAREAARPPKPARKRKKPR